MNCLSAIKLAFEGTIVAREDLPNEIYFKGPDGNLAVYDQDEGEYYQAAISQEDMDSEWIAYDLEAGETAVQFFFKMFAQPECPDGCTEDCNVCCADDNIQCPEDCCGCLGDAGQYPECEGCEGCDGTGADPNEDDDMEALEAILIALQGLSDRIDKVEEDKAIFQNWQNEIKEKIAGMEKVTEPFDFMKLAKELEPKQEKNPMWDIYYGWKTHPLDAQPFYCTSIVS